jgi:RNA polymerase sigma-70 factor (ECF subfamily)
MQTENREITELVRRAQSFPYGSDGYARAIEELIKASKTIIERIAYQFNWGFEADDVVQEVSIKVFTRLHGFRGDASYLTWLYRIAANYCLQEKRKWARRSVEYYAPGEMVYVLDLNDRSEKRTILGMYIAELRKDLPKKEREMFELRYVRELSIKQVVRLTGLTKAAVKNRTFRMVQQLRARASQLDRQPVKWQ